MSFPAWLEHPGRFTVLLTLLSLLAAGAVWQTADIRAFGHMHDDSLYVSAAKSLAEGDGYVVASLPDAPDQTKYPPAYSWLLSLVWRLWPEFPANLAAATALNSLLGALLVFTSGIGLRQIGLRPLEALLTAAVFAFHPMTLFWSGQLMSDVLFAALGISALVVADHSNRRRPDSWPLLAAVAGLLWVTSLTRSLGAAFAVGAAIAALACGRRVAALLWLTACFPLAMSVLAAAGPGSVPPADGYDQTLLYYTSYGGYWRFCVPDWATFIAQFNRMFLELLKHPSVVCFFLPAAGFATPTMQTFAIAVSAGVVFGIVGRVRLQPGNRSRLGLDRLHPLHWAALAYLPFVLLWNYALMTRFWLPFVPLLLAGAGFELQRLYRAVRNSLRVPAVADRIAAGVFALLIAALPAYGAWRYVTTRSGLAGAAQVRAELLPHKRAAYGWLSANAAPSDRVIAYEDVVAFLYTGLQGMRPLSLSTAAVYLQDEAVLNRDLRRLGDAAERIGADYWIVSPDDYSHESATEQVNAAVETYVLPLQIAFQSGPVRIYRLDFDIQQSKPTY